MSCPIKANAAVDTEASLGTSTLFEQPWWLDAVAPGAWGAVEVSSDGRVVARLPYVTEKGLGLRGLNMPPLTRFGETLRPYFRITRFSRRMGFLMAGREMTKALLGASNVPGKRT